MDINNNYHILIIPSFYPTKDMPLNGIFFKEQAIMLKKNNNTIGIIYPENRSIRRISFKGIIENHFQKRYYNEDGINVIRIHRYNIIPRRYKSGAMLWVSQARELARDYIVKYGRPDIIHAHNSLWAGYAAYLISKEHEIPYIITEHSSDFARDLIKKWEAEFAKIAYNYAKEVIAVSSPFSKLIERKLNINREIVVIPNRVDIDIFTLPEQPRDKKKYRFLTVCFLDEKKGLDNLLKAFSNMINKYNLTSCFLEIGGDGPIRKELEELVNHLGINRYVTFLGMLDRKKVVQAMWRANAFVLPSKYETFGIVYVEALATGIPVIGTKNGGPAEIISDEVGCLIDPYNIEELEARMVEIMDKNYDENKLRKYVINKYSDDAIYRQLLSVYQRVIK